jgi:tetratricopeptide (TPR) repeat protein
MTLYQTGKYQKAVQLFEMILTKYPENVLARKAHYQLGNIYFYKLGQPQMALKHLQDLYTQSPQGKNALKALELIGYIYDKSLNKCLDGIEAYRKLIRDYAAEIEADKYQLAIADCYFKLNDYKQAIAEYEVLVKQYPVRSAPNSKLRIVTPCKKTTIKPSNCMKPSCKRIQYLSNLWWIPN